MGVVHSTAKRNCSNCPVASGRSGRAKVSIPEEPQLQTGIERQARSLVRAASPTRPASWFDWHDVMIGSGLFGRNRMEQRRGELVWTCRFATRKVNGALGHDSGRSHETCDSLDEPDRGGFAGVGLWRRLLSLRYQIPGHRPQFGKVTVNTLYVIHVKGGKIQYTPGDQEIDTCVHSLFPHFGDSPCWYANRHTDKLVDI